MVYMNDNKKANKYIGSLFVFLLTLIFTNCLLSYIMLIVKGVIRWIKVNYIL